MCLAFDPAATGGSGGGGGVGAYLLSRTIKFMLIFAMSHAISQRCVASSLYH